MKTNGLQKLTETEQKFISILNNEKVERSMLDSQLTLEEKVQFGPYLTKLLQEKTGEDLEILIEKISGIMPQTVKNQIWENNHFNITSAISKLIDDYGKMPTKNMIAEQTGLSRQTIHKHLKDYATHPIYLEQIQSFKFMSDRILAKVFKGALNGEMKAARLYFEVLGYLGSKNESKITKATQNNFIQINQTMLSQDTIKQLKPEQLNVIENVLKGVLTNSIGTQDGMTNESK